MNESSRWSNYAGAHWYAFVYWITQLLLRYACGWPSDDEMLPGMVLTTITTFIFACVCSWRWRDLRSHNL